MNLELSRAARSRLHLAILDALDAEENDSDMVHAYAEALAWSEYAEDVIVLSRAIDAYTANAVFGTDYHYVSVDPSDLEETVGQETAHLAMRLAGIRRCSKGREAIWTDGPMDGRTRMLPVKLPVDLLEKWNNQ